MFKKVATIFCCVGLTLSAFAAPLRDPTRPPYVSQQTISNEYGSKIYSIKISDNHKLVQIDNKHYTVGDTFMGAKIIDITPYEVVLKDAHKEFTISMQSANIKQPANSEKGRN